MSDAYDLPRRTPDEELGARPADSILTGAKRTPCPHCRGRGVTPSAIRGTSVRCEYCDGLMTVTIDDAKVYLGVARLLALGARAG